MTKVCGLTRGSDVAAIARLPVDWLGFIFVRSSPRYAGELPIPTAETGRRKRVGVFRDEALHSLLRTAAKWALDGVQLHGSESPDFADGVRAAGYFVIKAVGVRASADIDRAMAYEGHVDYLLFDTPGGGTGRAFDWDMLHDYRGATPFLLAGGLGEDSAGALGAFSHPRFAGIDLNSKFETAPGVKDVARLQNFLAHAV